MEMKEGLLAPDGRSLLMEMFLWQTDRDATLAAARRSGCALGLWFGLAQGREKCQDSAAWLQDTHAKYGARFGRS
jgi:hypothetical protein